MERTTKPFVGRTLLLSASLLALASERPAAAQDAQASASAELDVGSIGTPSDDDGESPIASRAKLGLVLGGKVGGGIGTGPFGATPLFELEAGFALPPLERAIEIFVAAQYAQPGTDGSGAEPDPRLPDDGSFRYEISQQILTLALGGLYRLDLGNDLVMPYGGLGGRVYFLRTKIEGEAAGEPFGSNEETQADVGLVLLGGVDIFLGPGALLAELSFGYAAVDGFVLRDTDVGALNLAIGYRFIL